MNEKEKALELSLIFCENGDIIKPNIKSIKMAIKCCQQIIKNPSLTDEAWLNVPDEYKIQYWKKVIFELNQLKL